MGKTVFFLLGMGANLVSLVIINREANQGNRLQTLMLRCLASHDLTATSAGLFVFSLRLYLPTSMVTCTTFTTHTIT